MMMLDTHMLSHMDDKRKLQLSDTLAPVLEPFAASLASCNAALRGTPSPAPAARAASLRGRSPADKCFSGMMQVLRTM